MSTRRQLALKVPSIDRSSSSSNSSKAAISTPLRLFTALFQSILICWLVRLDLSQQVPGRKNKWQKHKEIPDPRSVRQSPSKAPVPCPALAFRYPKPPRRTARAASGFITGPPTRGGPPTSPPPPTCRESRPSGQRRPFLHLSRHLPILCHPLP